MRDVMIVRASASTSRSVSVPAYGIWDMPKPTPFCEQDNDQRPVVVPANERSNLWSTAYRIQ